MFFQECESSHTLATESQFIRDNDILTTNLAKMGFEVRI